MRAGGAVVSRGLNALALCSLVVLLAGPAWAEPGLGAGAQDAAQQQAHRRAEHERIQRERGVVAAERQAAEAACYQRFAVEECLRGVRAKERDALTALRHQEFELNDAQRKERAAQRLRLIEEKKNAVPAAPEAAVRSGGATVRVTPPKGPTVGSAAGQPPVPLQAAKVGSPELEAQRRTLAASQRAQAQRVRVQAHGESQALRSAELGQRAEQSRMRQQEVLKAAQERRERVQANREKALEAGRVPAAPLPPP